MARVTVTEIEKNDGVAIIRPNTTLTSWTNQSAAIDDENVAVEGIDGRNIVAGSVFVSEVAAGKVFTYTGTANVNVAAATIVTAGGNPVRIGPFAYSFAAPAMMMKVVCSFAITDTSFLVGGPANFQLYKSTDNGATYSAMTATYRREAKQTSVTIVTLDRSGGSSNQVYYALYAWGPAGPLQFTIGRIEFFVEKRLK